MYQPCCVLWRYAEPYHAKGKARGVTRRTATDYSTQLRKVRRTLTHWQAVRWSGHRPDPGEFSWRARRARVLAHCAPALTGGLTSAAVGALPCPRRRQLASQAARAGRTPEFGRTPEVALRKGGLPCSSALWDGPHQPTGTVDSAHLARPLPQEERSPKQGQGGHTGPLSGAPTKGFVTRGAQTR